MKKERERDSNRRVGKEVTRKFTKEEIQTAKNMF